MLFTSQLFLCYFLPLVSVIFWMLPKHRIPCLLGASYVFYGFWRVDFLLLLVVVTAIGYAAGLLVERSRTNARTVVLVATVTLLGALAWFKYAGFAFEIWNSLIALAATDTRGLGAPKPDIILPLGISFFTFQVISYLVDVLRGEIPPCRSFTRFATYVALFPQLVAGPIVRYRSISEELECLRPNPTQIERGVTLFMIGFCKKVWIANNLAPTADWSFSLHSPELAVAWLGVGVYTLQLYFDFSGYSDMAVGLGLLFGFTFPTNFRAPYGSTSLTEFWQRWHITMSTFFRDYVYIPLGGNRLGKLRTAWNLIFTMVLAGLWHGAGWNFVYWGGFHGLILACERLFALPDRCPQPRSIILGFQWARTMILVMCGWVLFRAPTPEGAASMFRGMLGINGISSGTLLDGRLDSFFLIVFLIAIIAVILEGRVGLRHSHNPAERPASETHHAPSALPPYAKIALLATFLLGLHELGTQEYNPFLYFQF